MVKGSKVAFHSIFKNLIRSLPLSRECSSRDTREWKGGNFQRVRRHIDPADVQQCLHTSIVKQRRRLKSLPKAQLPVTATLISVIQCTLIEKVV